MMNQSSVRIACGRPVPIQHDNTRLIQHDNTRLIQHDNTRPIQHDNTHALVADPTVPERGSRKVRAGVAGSSVNLRHEARNVTSIVRPASNSAGIRVGCSGWQYRHWRGNFYPADLAQHQWLNYYASIFDTVEINNTFYRLPEASAFAAWKKRVPKTFLYAVKASRFLTHMKKLNNPAQPLDKLFSRARVLGHHLGPVLYQLPPKWAVNVERLAVFLRCLPARRRHAIEFRDPSWYTDEVFRLLETHRVACCVHDMAGSATGRLAVGPFVYARFHGPTRYSGRYDDGTLDQWASWFADRLRGGTDVFAYFNNDVGGHAPRDALRLRQRLHGDAA